MRIGFPVQLVQQPVDDLAVQDRLFQNLFAVLGMDVRVEDALRLNFNQRPHLTIALTAAALEMERIVAALFPQRHARLQPALSAQRRQLLVDLHRSARDAARARAHEDHAILRGPAHACAWARLAVSSALVAIFIPRPPPLARISSSKANALSGFIFAWTSPSIVMTGARPPAPRHATVSRVKMPVVRRLALTGQTEVFPHSVIDRLGFPNMTCRAVADLDDVLALGFQREILEESRHAVHLGDHNAKLARDQLQIALAEIALLRLNILKNRDQRGLAATMHCR